MGHQICFQNVETGWHNALPLGNGKMGAMVYYQNQKIHIALNHYDCYYSGVPFQDPARQEKTLDELKRITDRRRKEPGYERSHYVNILNPQNAKARPIYGGSSYPQGGEVVIPVSECLEIRYTLLKLLIEEAKVIFEAGDGKRKVTAEIYVAYSHDGVVIQLTQTEPGLWDRAYLWYQMARGQKAYVYEQEERAGSLKLCCKSKESAQILHETYVDMPENGTKMCMTASILPGVQEAEKAAKSLWKEQRHAQREHSEKWKQFWKSSITLPDSYLEKLWYLYVYLLECCSGRGCRDREQACGLSGLWDIRKPCMWGNMWYWDVNIQTAFYGAFASNHMEHIRVFCDAFLSYREEIYKFAKRIYGKKGWALDYPHTLYHCIQPWCALFLWNYYAYTNDLEFLREKAYPVFQEILAFFCEISVKGEDGFRHLEYDICPEQGPVARDTTIAIAALKQLTQYTIEAARRLEKPQDEIRSWETLLTEFPAYAKTHDGMRWKDSSDVQDEIFLRHPSVLMPIFPAEEVHGNSEKGLKVLADHTIQYAMENTEIGTFGFPWIAAAAARMGEGESAVRILYEKGLDYVTHSNGLGYEESERFINYCHLTKPANYLPVMCEEAGGVTAVINLLLLQHRDGIISVFPAIPDGNDRYAVHKTEYQYMEQFVSRVYGPWEDCEFENLLAPGGFEVSAQMKNKEICWIRVKATQKGVLRIWIPSELLRKTSHIFETENSGNIITELQEGEILEFGMRKEGRLHKKENTEILVHRAVQTHRRIFLGEDIHTQFYKSIDSMVCPYRLGQELHDRMSPYIFDFTQEMSKDYDDVYEKQILYNAKSVLYAGGPRQVGLEKYEADIGYGFLKEDRITRAIRKRKTPDAIRRDFVEGTTSGEFGVELPAGKYEMLVISGDEEECSLTNLAISESGIYLEGSLQKEGRYQCRRIPLIHEKDGVLKLKISTAEGMKWKLNAILINKDYTLL